MPPSSISSAVALVGLCSLAALETGGCSNSSKSLASVTRSGLPLLASLLNGTHGRVAAIKISLFGAAKGSSADAPEATDSHEVGLATVPGLVPHCGRYDFTPEGGLLAWDALASRESRASVASALAQREPSLSWSTQRDGSLMTTRQHLGHQKRIEVRRKADVQLPAGCQRPLPTGTQTVVLVVADLGSNGAQQVKRVE